MSSILYRIAGQPIVMDLPWSVACMSTDTRSAIPHVNRAGCAWRYLPSDLLPCQTVYGYLAAWRDDGALQRLHDQLPDQVRAAAAAPATTSA
jgi:transposase